MNGKGDSLHMWNGLYRKKAHQSSAIITMKRMKRRIIWRTNATIEITLLSMA